MKSLQQIADTAAEAAQEALQHLHSSNINCLAVGGVYFDEDAPARLAFAQSVVEQINAWVACSERMPTNEDRDEHGHVLVRSAVLGTQVRGQFGPAWTHWMRIPPIDITQR